MGEVLSASGSVRRAAGGSLSPHDGVVAMTRIASLGMYDLPGTAAALDALWADVAARLRTKGIHDVPDALTRHRQLEGIWRDPNLLLGQTCGYPLRRYLARDVRVVGTPVYDLPGCEGPYHCSFIIVPVGSPHDDLWSLRGSRAAVNGPDSNTGMNLFRAVIAPLADGRPFFAGVALTGAHSGSLSAVASGKADVAAIDCVSFWLISRERPDLADKVRILAATPSSPGLPLVTSSQTSDEDLTTLRGVLDDAARAPGLLGARRKLGVVGFRVLADDAYDIISKYERDAAALGYPLLA
jgi:ABC-type phosphate/phosphonate transport system substrate-binding protein